MINPSVELVRVDDLGYSFGAGKPILESVTLTVRKGERVALMGPSGSGKTTLLKVIAGLSGYKSYTGICQRQGRLVMGFQQPLLLNYMTVRANILLPSRILKIQHTVDKIFQLLDIEDLLDRYPFQLSGGQQRRVSLARSLAYPNAEGLLLDEAFSGVDEPLRERILIELQAALDITNLTCLFATHSPLEAAFFADRVVFLGNSPATIVAEHTVRLARSQREALINTPGFFEEMMVIRQRLNASSKDPKGKNYGAGT